MKTIVLSVTLSAELLAALCVVISIVWPRQRIWPPAQTHNWRGKLVQGLFLLSGLGIVMLGLLDRNGWALPPWLRYFVGLPLWAVGNALAAWAVIVLGRKSTWGEEGALVITGPYRYSRNPQYGGFMLGLSGWAILTASTLTLTAVLAGLLPLILVPFAEEPWLAEKYGSAYITYCQQTSRFLQIHRGAPH